MANLTTTAIITKGLHCGPACQGIITSRFSLVCKDIPTPPVNRNNTGGGPYPANQGAWNQSNNIQNFYQPVEQQPFYVPRDKEADYFRKFKAVEIRVKLGEKEVVKEYRIPVNRAKYVISVINLVNSTRDRIKVVASSVQRRLHNITVVIKNLKKRF